MRHFRSPLLSVFLAVMVFFRPGSAIAAIPLAPVAVGAMIAAAGVMVNGAAVYAPPTFAQANAAVNSLTGDITRKCVVAKAFAEGLSGGLRGFESQYTLDFTQAAQWVRNHAPSFPALSPAVATATTEQATSPSVGFNFVWSDATTRKILTLGPEQSTVWYGYTWASVVSTTPISMGGGMRCQAGGQTVFYNFVQQGGNYALKYRSMTIGATNDPVTPIPATFNPSAFASAFPNTEAAHAETDRIAAENPAAVKTEPMPLTAQQIAEAEKAVAALQAQAAADEAQALADAHPEDISLQAAANAAKALADQAAISASAAQSALETAEPDEPLAVVPPANVGAGAESPQIDFSPLFALKDLAVSKYPFNLLSGISSSLSGLVAEPQSPSLSMSSGFGQTVTFDFSSWNTAAAVVRGFMLFCFNAVIMHTVVRRWS